MNNQVTDFKTLEQRLIEKLIERGNAFNTIRNTRYVCHRLQREFIRRGCNYFRLPVALSILTDVRASGVSERYCRTLHTVISRFDMLSREQWDDRITVDNSDYSVSDDQEELVKGYLAHCRMNGLRETTIRIKRTAILVFFTSMNAQGCHSICRISPEIICKICTGVNNKNLWGEFRVFLRYLSESGILDRDYSLAVPHRRKPQIIPPLYTNDEIAATENAIDRSTAIGKRNYAMVLLASRLGMRSGDIVRLTFQNFTAVDRHIQFIQEKTGKEQVVFLPDDVYTVGAGIIQPFWAGLFQPIISRIKTANASMIRSFVGYLLSSVTLPASTASVSHSLPR